MIQLITRSSEKVTWSILILLLSQCSAIAYHGGNVQNYDWNRFQRKTMAPYNQLDRNQALNDRIRYANSHTDAMAHYCLGNTLSKLGQKESALREYTLALNYSYDDVLSNYCNQAIAAWLGPPSKADTKDARSNSRYAYYEVSSRIPIRTGDIKIDRAIDTIEREGADVTHNNSWGGDGRGSGGGGGDVKQFQEEVEDFKRVVTNSRNKFNNGSVPDLDLVGTDLYVRHYANSSSNIKQLADSQELVATQERLVLAAHSRGGKTISRVVPESDEHKPQSNSDLKVHGRVMP